MYERGCSDADGEFVVSKDTSMALKYFEEAAEKDHLKALLHLSALLTTLDPPYFRPEQARQLLHRAADRYSSPDAFNLLGQLYEHGLGLPAPDLEQAGTWYKKAAREGHSGGLFNLAVWYESGNEGEDGRKRAAPLMAEPGCIKCRMIRLAANFDVRRGRQMPLTESMAVCSSESLRHPNHEARVFQLSKEL
ncbi:uncharacterized protein BJ171DRAFT_207122 [Polychytrium aggregatum]|uniref:uncharacterized protein n=1 Tax=Polychytrium aggregatum TaxID=110093 RepID=UPI0022FDFADD|nr:uncharacterized protein BJ171DRAFT_207122 [Polychytrium aggregatum]KAI9208420.1 hypothetical protein BJ171DRAFT_207122 [Polychytrium aggregatum]